MTTSLPLNLIARGTEPTLREDPCCAPGAPSIKMEEVAANARLLAAMADPTRLGILSVLSGLDEPLCVCEIVAQFDLGQPTISHHLRVLREAHLVDCEKRGLWVYYWLNRDIFSGVTTYLNSMQKAASGVLAL